MPEVPLATRRPDHSPDAIRRRLADGQRPSYLRDWIYGGIDGAVTTFAVVASVVGAELSARVIVVLGLANLAADGFSMAAGNFSGTRAERDEQELRRRSEAAEIDADPEGEREEVRQIYLAKGFSGGELESIVERLTSDRERWIEFMLREEHGLAGTVRSPWVAGAATFSAFALCGVAPLVPYLASLPNAFAVSSAVTAGVFVAIGCVRARWSPYPWWKTGAGTLFAGGSAALVAYWIGRFLKSFA